MEIKYLIYNEEFESYYLGVSTETSDGKQYTFSVGKAWSFSDYDSAERYLTEGNTFKGIFSIKKIYTLK